MASGIGRKKETMTREKVIENKLRRMAERQGLKLRKSRRRDERALDYGTYWLVDLQTNSVEVGGTYGASLDEVGDALFEGLSEDELSEEVRRIRSRILETETRARTVLATTPDGPDRERAEKILEELDNLALVWRVVARD